MRITAFLKSLIPGMSKDKMKTDTQLAREELNNHVLPVFGNFKTEFAGYNFQAKFNKDLQSRFNNVYKPPHDKSENFCVVIYDNTLKQLNERFDFIEGLINKTINTDILPDSMTLKQINTTQLAEVASFVTRFSRRMLNIVVTIETNVINGKRELDSLVPGEVDYIQKNFPAYVYGLNVMTVETKKAAKLMEKVPEVLVSNSNANEVERSAGADGDPFRMGLIPVILNPVYHIGMRVAEYQASRYAEAKLEQQVLENKIIYLKKRLDGENDAALEKTIDEYSRLAAKKTREIAMMEEKYVND